MPVPFVIYADLEAVTENIQGCKPIIIPNHILNLIKTIQDAATVTKLFAAMMISIQSLHRFTEAGRQSRRLCKRYSKRCSIVKRSLPPNLRSH